MSNILDFPMNASVEIINTDILLDKVKAVNDCLNTFMLTQEQANKIGGLLEDMLSQAKQDAFKQGFDLGIRICKDALGVES